MDWETGRALIVLVGAGLACFQVGGLVAGRRKEEIYRAGYASGQADQRLHDDAQLRQARDLWAARRAEALANVDALAEIVERMAEERTRSGCDHRPVGQPAPANTGGGRN